MNISLGMPSTNNYSVHNIVRIIGGEYNGLIAEIIKMDNYPSVQPTKNFAISNIAMSSSLSILTLSKSTSKKATMSRFCMANIQATLGKFKL